MMTFSKISSALTVAIVLISTLIVLITHHDKKSLPHESVPQVTLANLTTQIVPKTVHSYGTTVSPNSATVTAQTNGTITKIAFEPGDLVKKGQLLFDIQSSDISNQIQELKAGMLASKDIYDRASTANHDFPGTIAKETVEQEKLKYQQDLAAYSEAETAAHVTSPIDGLISDTNVTVGSAVSVGTVLAQVINPQSLQVKYSLPSEYANLVQNGQRVFFYPNDSTQCYMGTVSYVSPLLNSNDFTLTLRADLDNTTTLKPYLFGKVVQVIDPHHKALVIPQNLVQTDAGGFYIYAVNNKKIIKRYFNPVGVNNHGMIEVGGGLTNQTKIVVSDTADLSPGLIVKVKNQ